MPLYEYRCKNGHEFEARKSLGDRQHAKCPSCILIADKVMSLPHDAPIPGIYNRVNRNWNENGNPVEFTAPEVFSNDDRSKVLKDKKYSL